MGKRYSKIRNSKLNKKLETFAINLRSSNYNYRKTSDE